jgi:hypothetical protein
MKRIKRLLFNFNSSYFYTFVAGILVSLAVNLFTTALLSKDLTVSIYRVHGIALSLLLSSIGAFGVSALLENARGKWESDGLLRDLEVIRAYIEKRIRWIWFFFTIIIIGIIISALLYGLR